MPDDTEGKGVTQNAIPDIPKPGSVNPPSPQNDPPSPPAQPEPKSGVQTDIDHLEKRMGTAETLMAWLTAAIAFFALCSVGVGVLQWLVMGDQLKVMRYESSRNRPWVGVEDDVVFDENSVGWVGARGEAIVRKQKAEGKLPMRVLYHLKNSGDSPALNTMMVVRPVTFPENGTVDESRIRSEIEEDCQIAEKAITRGNGDLILPSGVHAVPYQFGEWEPTKFLFTPGCIVYRDVDGGLHHTKICYAVAMFVAPKAKGLESCQDQSAN
jgi:hypothetical protein